MRNIDGGTLMQNPDVKAEDKLRNIVTFMASEKGYYLCYFRVGIT